MSWVNKLKEEAEKLPAPGEFWKPSPGTYKVVLGEPEFRDQSFTQKDGTAKTVRVADFPLYLVEDGKLSEKKVWSIKVSRHEKSTYQKIVRAVEQATEEDMLHLPEENTTGVALVVEVRGEGRDREWIINTPSELKRKLKI